MKTIKKRRKENKTDYLKRINLLKSRKPRLAYRRTNRYIIAQYVESEEARDLIKSSANSKELLKHGWPKEAQGGLKSISASYLTGFLIGKKIKKEKLKDPIIDLGMYRVLHKTRIYAFIKGVIDAGIPIKCDKEFFPSEEKIKGKIPFEEIKNKIEKH